MINVSLIFIIENNIPIGEQLDNEQVEAVFKDCMGEEDDEGQIKYARKYEAMPMGSIVSISFSENVGRLMFDGSFILMCYR